MSILIYTKAQVDVLLAKSPAEVVEVSGTYPLRSTGTSNLSQPVNWTGHDFPLTTTGYAVNGDRYYQLP